MFVILTLENSATSLCLEFFLRWRNLCILCCMSVYGSCYGRLFFAKANSLKVRAAALRRALPPIPAANGKRRSANKARANNTAVSSWRKLHMLITIFKQEGLTRGASPAIPAKKVLWLRLSGDVYTTGA